MPQRFDVIVDRQDTASQKWDRYRGQDILPMWVADTDFRAPQAVMDALAQRVEHGVFGYTLPPAGLVDIIIERLRRLYDWQVNAEDILFLPGLVCGLNLVTRACSENSPGIMVPTPIYPPFVSSVLHAGKPAVKVPMQLNEGRWVLDMQQLAEQASHNKLLLLCNPHNPGGTVYRRDELQQLAKLAVEQDLTVCSDEIHCDLLLDRDARHIPLASLSQEIAQRCITLMAPSKTFNIAGLGCSFAIVQNPQLRKKLIRAKRGIVPDVNLLGYTAADAAYRHGQEWLTAQLDYLRGNRDYLQQQIALMPGLEMAHIEATYLGWIDCSKLKLSNPHRFFEEAGVGLSPGRDFGAPSFVRLNFGCSRALLEQALERMRSALSQAPG